MSNENDGGPAHPRPVLLMVGPDMDRDEIEEMVKGLRGALEEAGGLTLRDYFAAASLMGLRARAAVRSDYAVETAWADADAMLAKRGSSDEH